MIRQISLKLNDCTTMETSSSPSPLHNRRLLEGILLKRSGKVLKLWKERSVSLYDNGLLRSKKLNKSDSRSSMITIDITECEISLEVEQSGQHYSFRLDNEQREYRFATTDKSTAQRWLELIQFVADDNAAGRREWSQRLSSVNMLNDDIDQWQALINLPDRNWNKEWHNCMSVFKTEDQSSSSVHLRRIHRVYSLWSQFTECAKKIIHLFMKLHEKGLQDVTFLPRWLKLLGKEAEGKRDTFYICGILFIESKSHWTFHKELRHQYTSSNDMLCFFSLFYRNLQNSRGQVLADTTLPLTALLEYQGQRFLATTKPSSKEEMVLLSQEECQNLFDSLSYKQLPDIDQILPNAQLPYLEAYRINSREICLLHSRNAYSDILPESFRPQKGLYGFRLCADSSKPLELLSKQPEFLTLHPPPPIIIPYLGLHMYKLSTDSDQDNARASLLCGFAINGDVCITYNDRIKVRLDLRSALFHQSAMENTIILPRRKPNLMQFSQENAILVENHIKKSFLACIEGLAGKLITLGDHIESPFGEDMDTDEMIQINSGQELVDVVHDHGINLCFLPVLRHYLEWSQIGIRQLISCEIIARTAKHFYRFKLLSSPPERIKKDDEIKTIAASLLNAVLLPIAHAYDDETDEPWKTRKSPSSWAYNSSEFWDVTGKLWLHLGSYSAALSLLGVELSLDMKSWRKELNPLPLLHALLRNLRIHLSAPTFRGIFHTGRIPIFCEYDIEMMGNGGDHPQIAEINKKLELFRMKSIFGAFSRLEEDPEHGDDSRVKEYPELCRKVLSPMERSSPTLLSCQIEMDGWLRSAIAYAIAGNYSTSLGHLSKAISKMKAACDSSECDAENAIACYFIRSIVLEASGESSFTECENGYSMALKLLQYAYCPPNDAQYLGVFTTHPLGLELAQRLLYVMEKNHQNNLQGDSLIKREDREMCLKWLKNMIQLIQLHGDSKHLFHQLDNNTDTNTITITITNTTNKKFCTLLNAIEDKLLDRHPSGVTLSKSILDECEGSLQKTTLHQPSWARENGCLLISGKLYGLSNEEETNPLFFHDTKNNLNMDVLLPLEMKPLLAIWKVACGYRHSAILSTGGILMTFGHGECGRLGHGNELSQDNPKVVSYFRENEVFISDVSCGREHTAALSNSGTLYCWGWGEAGRLGVGETGKEVYPKKVLPHSDLTEAVISIACGREHTVIAVASGKVYAFGAGYGGRLGTGDEKDALTPQLVRGKLEKEMVVQVAAGDAHSACVTSTGMVFTWGFAASGALGLGEKNVINQLTPCSLNDLFEVALIKKVTCGAYHTLALGADGTLYVWGDGHAGQLGLSMEIVKNVYVPTKVDFFLTQDHYQDTLTSVACGTYTSIAITKMGKLFIWGNPSGDPVDPKSLLPQRIHSQEGIQIECAAAGAYHLVVSSMVRNSLAAHWSNWNIPSTTEKLNLIDDTSSHEIAIVDPPSLIPLGKEKKSFSFQKRFSIGKEFFKMWQF